MLMGEGQARATRVRRLPLQDESYHVFYTAINHFKPRSSLVGAEADGEVAVDWTGDVARLPRIAAGGEGQLLEHTQPVACVHDEVAVAGGAAGSGEGVERTGHREGCQGLGGLGKNGAGGGGAGTWECAACACTYMLCAPGGLRTQQDMQLHIETTDMHTHIEICFCTKCNSLLRHCSLKGRCCLALTVRMRRKGCTTGCAHPAARCPSRPNRTHRGSRLQGMRGTCGCMAVSMRKRAVGGCTAVNTRKGVAAHEKGRRAG